MPSRSTGPDARQLYEDVVARAMLHALRRVDRSEALEVAHDVACTLVRRRFEGRDDPSDARSFEGLIHRAVANAIANRKRGADRRATAERVHLDERTATSPGWEPADHTVRENELLYIVEGAIADMPDVMREVFRLIRLEGASYKEAARRLGIGVGTVHTHLVRANARLREAVARYQGEDAPANSPRSAATAARNR
jgi:RNA polymerase sigma factor (sigma-70 family)